jgi:hypothetical protein
MQSTRRGFLRTVTAAGALAALRPLAEPADAAAATAPADGPWDLSWLDQLTGRHKQVFDLGTLGGARVGPLHVVKNYLNAHREVYGLDFPAINTVVGIAYSAFPLNAADALWQKYGLGERWQTKDPKTGTWAVRNIFADAAADDPLADETVAALKRRGTIFWQCNNALNGIVRDLAAAMHQPADAVRADLVAGLLPGTKLIPAHTMLIGLAQEHGCTYERLN